MGFEDIGYICGLSEISSMKINTIKDITEFNNLKKGTIITLIKEGDCRLYSFISICPFEENNIILSSPYNGYHNELFYISYKEWSNDIWLIGNGFKEYENFTESSRNSQLKEKLKYLKEKLKKAEFESLNLIKSQEELKNVNKGSIITVVKLGKIEKFKYLTFSEELNTFLFLKNSYSQSGINLDKPILTSKQVGIPTYKDYCISGCSSKKEKYDYKELYSTYLNTIIIKGDIADYKSIRGLIKIQIFQLENLIKELNEIDPSSFEEYKELIKNIK